MYCLEPGNGEVQLGLIGRESLLFKNIIQSQLLTGWTELTIREKAFKQHLW